MNVKMIEYKTTVLDESVRTTFGHCFGIDFYFTICVDGKRKLEEQEYFFSRTS